MSNEPMLQRFAAHSPAAEPRSDAETMQAALLRMKAAARQPEAIERLRAELDEMREVIANVRAALLSDSDPSALLDDLDARTERVMAAVIGGTLPAARPAAAPPAEEPEAATPAEELSRAEELSPAQNFSPAEAFSPGDEPPTLPLDEQTLLDALRDDPAAETAQAPQAEAAPQADPIACRPSRRSSRSLVCRTRTVPARNPLHSGRRHHHGRDAGADGRGTDRRDAGTTSA